MQEDASFKVCWYLGWTDSLTSNSFKGKGKDAFSGRECNAEVIKGSYETTLGYLSVEETLAYLRDSILEKSILYY